jgi:ketosteroid isomerase-like protein
MDRSTIETLVRQAYAARDASDVDSLMAIFHPEASFGLAGDRGVLPVTGAVQGHPAIRGSMDGFIQTFEFIERDILSILVDGHRAAFHCRLKIRFVPTNTVVTTEVLDLFKFDDSKIVDLVEFADTALIKHLVSTAK